MEPYSDDDPDVTTDQSRLTAEGASAELAEVASAICSFPGHEITNTNARHQSATALKSLLLIMIPSYYF
jgi:hypothetical protein